MRKVTPPIERFMAKIKVDENGCWIWQARTAGAGYGAFFPGSHKGRFATEYAHRWSYEHFVGPIPEGLEIDHLCRVRLCANPEHLEAVTHRENNRRSESPTAKQARQTHCQRGHEFTPENTYRTQAAPNKRQCKACHKLCRDRRRRAA